MSQQSPPCGQCKNFDRQQVGSSKGPKDAKYGWCAALSVYPKTGMVVPDGAKTTDASVTKPVIKMDTTVVKDCPYFQKV